MPTYSLYELNHAVLTPLRAIADVTRIAVSNPVNPISYTPYGKGVAAMCELFERTTRRYSRPDFNIDYTIIDDRKVRVSEQTVAEFPFCTLINFKKHTRKLAPQPKVLIVAPMSGHYATLLRGTVESFLPNHDVYITDWEDARMVPLADGNFDLDDYIDYVIEMIQILGSDLHVVAVCQPSVPVMAAISLLESRKARIVPKSMILMGGPIDTRLSPTEVNVIAKKNGLQWFEDNLIMKVPFPYPGFTRLVYPGFMQLSGFMSMNLDRHIKAHKDFFNYLVEGDGDSAEKHREFYDEYLAVMDLTAEFYLQTVDTVFIKHSLPKGEMMHRGELIDPSKIKRVALLTVEGENDDITGHGQTKAAHKLCSSLLDSKKQHHLQKGVGHYGVFNGSKFRNQIMPVISNFIHEMG